MKHMIAALVLFSSFTVAQAYERERVVKLGPNNTPPGLFQPKPVPPKPEFKGTCMVLPCGQKPVQFVPARRP